MTRDRRKLVLAVVFLGALVALSLTLGRGSSTGSATKAGLAKKNASAIGRIRESQREAQIAEGANIDPDSAAGEELAARAYPSDEVTFGERQAAIAAGAKVAKRKAKHQNAWESLGPSTLNVDRLGTQTYQRGTQWSGRETALAVDPKCNAKKCALYIGAAGGGVWRSKDALAKKPKWNFISGDIPTSAIGSITVDPTDPSGDTIYVGTGEANGSGDSEAGLGLYRSTDGGDSWSLVGAGRRSAAALPANRSIGGVAIDPTNANHILIATRTGARGVASNGGAVTAPGPATGIYQSTDGGATFTLTRTGTAFEVKFDPSHAGVAYAAFGGVGLIRSTTGGTTWETIFSGTREPLLVLARHAREREHARLPLRRERRRPVEPGLPHRRRGPARGDADRVEQRGLDAALQPGRRDARLRQLRLLRRAVQLRHGNRLTRGPAGHGRALGPDELQRAAAVRRSWRAAFRRPLGPALDRRRGALDRPDR